MKIRKHMRQLSHMNGLLLKNPMLTMGCFLAMAVVPVVSLRTAVALTLLLTVVSIPTYLTMSFLGGRLRGVWRVAASPLLASLYYIPAWFITTAAFPGVESRFGFYLPILVLDIFFTARCSVLGPRLKPHWMALDVTCCCLGMGFALCLIGSIREYLGNGTLWGATVYFGETLSGLLLPFGGFFVLAFVMALNNLLSRLVRHAVRNAVEFEKLEERSHE